MDYLLVVHMTIVLKFGHQNLNAKELFKVTLIGFIVWLLLEKKIFSGSRDNTIKVWNLDTGECLATLKEHTDYVTSLAIDGNILYSGSMDTTIRVWNIDNLNCLHVLKGHTNNVFSLLSAHSTLYSASWDKSIRIWQ